MGFNPEPAHRHGSIGQVGVVLANLGTPDAPTPGAVRVYLKEFLSDPRVVEIPRVLWWVILNGIILPLRSRKSARKYASIWTSQGSPLRLHTEQQAQLLQQQLSLRGHAVRVAYGMRYGSPSLSSVIDQLKSEGCDRILIVPAYPQYSGTTTASVFDALFAHLSAMRNMPELRLIKHYHDDDGYIDALAASVRAHWAQHGRPDKLVMSFHGVPRRTLLQGDPYHCECHKTGRLLGQKLGLAQDDYLVSFQSRFGKAEWLQPYTAPMLKSLAQQGLGRVDVICPGFTSDCLETLEEIAMEGKEDFLAAGGKTFHYLPCLNEDPRWIDALATLVEAHAGGWPLSAAPEEQAARRADAATGRAQALTLGASD